MSSLREIKDRIGSVRSTLKITSAMKLVSSAKLRKAQKVIEGMRPYADALEEILSAVGPVSQEECAGAADAPVAAVVISSNSSLCGGFNANVIRTALELRKQYASLVFFPVGRKCADALKKAGFTPEADYNDIIAHTSYDKTSAFSRSLIERYRKGEFSKILLVYNRFISTAVQKPTVEQYMPYEPEAGLSSSGKASAAHQEDYIFEPDAATIASSLLPQMICLRFYAAVLDSAAAEQAARTIAMQTATDNGEHLLSDLTLEYNKGRQQKITSEILDLVGGAGEQQ